jgi:FdhD protein
VIGKSVNVTTPQGQERIVEREILKLTSDRGEASTDVVTVEEPLEIQIHKESIAVVMRTPKDDFDLVAGFLLTEGIIRSPGELGAVSYCETAEPPNRENVIEVRLADGASFDVEQLKRNFYASSSCGICGKASIEQIKTQAAPIEADFRVRSDMLYELSDRLRQRQAVFEQTGSLHAAGLFDAAGELLVLREDVGRHNAVDKVVGSFVLRDELPPKESVLMVSGRTSFEIVQKALMAGIPIVAAVSAPSSLAVDLAREANMTLVGFLRGRGCNVYSGENRIRRD